MAKKLAVVFGIIFVLVGLLGFVNNPIIGMSENAYFVADTMHNIVHLIIGVLLLVASSRGENASALSLKVFGVVYLILFIAGLVQVGAEGGKILGIAAANQADNWLHLFLGIVLLIAGFMGGNKNAVMMDKTTV